LWHVKRGFERARLGLAIGADDEVEAHVELAARRLSELNELMSTRDADPEVVAMVSAALGDHTRAADERLARVGQDERAALVDRLDDHVERQVAVLDVLMDVDCADSTGPQCVALADAGEASVDLAESAGVVALVEEPPAVTGTVSEPPDTAVSSSGASSSEGPAAAATASGATAAVSEVASSERPSTPSESSSEAASPSVTPPTAAASAPPEQATGQTPSAGGGSGGQEPSGPSTSVTPGDPTTTSTPAADAGKDVGVKIDIAP
jgi:hypothetical protein